VIDVARLTARGYLKPRDLRGRPSMRASDVLSSNARPIASDRSAVLVPALLAAALGLFMIWGVGFSPIAAIHNAAHDLRHASGFPCH
jgi:cobalt transporter subunit CbtB